MKKNNKTPSSKIFVRVMAFILVALMLIGCLSIVIVYLSSGAGAEEYEDDFIIRVGLMYGSGVTVAFETTSEFGYFLGLSGKDNSFTDVIKTSSTVAAAVCSGNIVNESRELSVTGSANADVGGYSVIVPSDLTRIENDIISYTALFGNLINVFPAYINGTLYVSIGQFTSYDAADVFLRNNSVYFPEGAVNSPSVSGVTLLDTLKNDILFILDDPEMQLGIRAVQDENDEDKEYIRTPAGNDYDGVFAYARYRTSSVDGVSVTNILDLETYIEGVIPSEVHNYWNVEALRAFAVAVRTYTIRTYTLEPKHTELGIDICNSSCCQVYKGRKNVNEAVKIAVRDTKGLISVYNGEAAKLGYSSCVGGVTVNPWDAWGSTGDYPYLDAKATPWEKCENYSHGLWTVEVSPTELFNYLQKKGYTILKGNIANIEIIEYAEKSSYVKRLRITDVFGTDLIIKFADNVRIALAGYIYSANFVVGMGGQDVEQKNFSLSEYSEKEKYKGPSIMTEDGAEHDIDLSQIPVMTNEGLYYLIESDSIPVLTSDGQTEFDPADLPKTESSENSNIAALTAESVEEIKVINLPGSSNNFVFVGKGWGHGVGLSQYGFKELADSGYSYRDILSVYLPGTELVDFRTILNKSE